MPSAQGGAATVQPVNLPARAARAEKSRAACPSWTCRPLGGGTDVVPAAVPLPSENHTTVTLRRVEIDRCAANERVVFQGKGGKASSPRCCFLQAAQKGGLPGMRRTPDLTGGSGLLHQTQARCRSQLVPRSRQQAVSSLHPEPGRPPWGGRIQATPAQPAPLRSGGTTAPVRDTAGRAVCRFPPGCRPSAGAGGAPGTLVSLSGKPQWPDILHLTKPPRTCRTGLVRPTQVRRAQPRSAPPPASCCSNTKPPPPDLPIATPGKPSPLNSQPGKARQNRFANLARLHNKRGGSGWIWIRPAYGGVLSLFFFSRRQGGES